MLEKLCLGENGHSNINYYISEEGCDTGNLPLHIRPKKCLTQVAMTPKIVILELNMDISP